MEAELRFLVSKLDLIKSEVGVDDRKQKGKSRKGGDIFMDLKSDIVTTIDNIGRKTEELKELQETEADRKEVIAVVNAQYKMLRSCDEWLTEMRAMQEKERTKRVSKFKPEELDGRDEWIANLDERIEEARALVRARGGDVMDAELGDVDGVETLDAFAGGDDGEYGAGASYTGSAGAGAGAGGGGGEGEAVHEALTQEQEQVLMEHQRASQAEEEKLEQLEGVVSDIGQLAVAVGDEGRKQQMMLDEISSEVETQGDRLTALNQDLGEQLKKMRGSDKRCMDIICCIVLLGLATVIYNVLKSRI